MGFKNTVLLMLGIALIVTIVIGIMTSSSEGNDKENEQPKNEKENYENTEHKNN